MTLSAAIFFCSVLLVDPSGGSSAGGYGGGGWQDGGYQRRVPRDVMVNVINDLGLALLEVHNEHNENNIAISPYGATSVLVALVEGLTGGAAHEIRYAIHLPQELSIVRIGLRDIHRHLKSYFIPKEGFLAGLTLSHENITLNREYESILRFYGYDVDSFNNPVYPESPSTTPPSKTEGTSTVMLETTTAPLTTEPATTTEEIARMETDDTTETTVASTENLSSLKPERTTRKETTLPDLEGESAGTTKNVPARATTNLDMDSTEDIILSETRYTTPISISTTPGISVTTEESTPPPSTIQTVTDEDMDIFTSKETTMTTEAITEVKLETSTNTPTKSLDTTTEMMIAGTTIIPEMVTPLPLIATTQDIEENINKQGTEKQSEEAIKTTDLTTTLSSATREESISSEIIPSGTKEESLTSVKPDETSEMITSTARDATEDFSTSNASENNVVSTLSTENNTAAESTPSSVIDRVAETNEESKTTTDAVQTTTSVKPNGAFTEESTNTVKGELEATTELKPTRIASTTVASEFQSTNTETTKELMDSNDDSLEITQGTSSERKDTTEIMSTISNAMTENSSQGVAHSETTTEVMFSTTNRSETTDTTVTTSDIRSTIIDLGNFANTGSTDSALIRDETTVATSEITEADDRETTIGLDETTTNLSVTIDDTTSNNIRKRDVESSNSGVLNSDTLDDPTTNNIRKRDVELSNIDVFNSQIESSITSKNIHKDSKLKVSFVPYSEISSESVSASQPTFLIKSEGASVTDKNEAVATSETINPIFNEELSGLLKITANITTPNKSRKKRSVIDYLIARYYDNYYISSSRRYLPPPKPHYSNHQPEVPYTFLVNGKYRETNISFMTYDTVLPFYYIPGLDAMALSFPLDSNMYYLLLVLPVDEQGINKLIRDFRKVTTLESIVENLKYTHVKAVIPSFTLKGYVVLTPSLQKLCIRKIFEPRHADFSQLTPEKDIYVTNIEQAVTVTIRNYVDPSNGSGRNLQAYRPVEFKADHPFLYFVMDSQIHVNLMAGKIVNPLNSRIR